MSRSMIHARRLLLGTFCAASLGFGAAQAFASPAQARSASCELTGYSYLPRDGCPECPSGFGYCDGLSSDCICLE